MRPTSSQPKLPVYPDEPVHHTEPSRNTQVDAGKPSAAVRSGSNLLVTVNINWNFGETAESVVNAARMAQPELPTYRPDGAGAILLFHTESGCQVLGGMRENPALQGQNTEDGSAFPPQMTTTLGGYMDAPERLLKDILVDGVRRRLLPKAAGEGDGLQILEKLLGAIAKPEGWESGVCVHTDKWTNSDGTDSTMCYLTATKHLECTDSQLEEIRRALASSMSTKRSHGEDTRTLMSFCFSNRDDLVASAGETYALDEKAKAEHVFRQFGSKVAVTFNDLAVATLAQNGGLAKEHATVPI